MRLHFFKHKTPKYLIEIREREGLLALLSVYDMQELLSFFLFVLIDPFAHSGDNNLKNVRKG